MIDLEEVRDRYRDEIERRFGRKRGKRAARAMRRAIDELPGTVLDAPDGTVLTWSDLHLGHARIIELAGRPFADVARMDTALWEALEEASDPGSTLVIVGDVAMRAALDEATWNRIAKIPAREKHLVVGNHDVTGAGTLRVKGFDGVWSVMTSPGDPPLVWSHVPLAEVPDGHVNVHGHMHDAPPERTAHINVAVEQLRYAPVRLGRLRPLAQALAGQCYPPGETNMQRVESLEREERALGRTSNARKRGSDECAGQPRPGLPWPGPRLARGDAPGRSARRGGSEKS